MARKTLGKSFVDKFSMMSNEPPENTTETLMKSNRESASNISRVKKTNLQQNIIQSFMQNPQPQEAML